jgi:hypothetical protein
MYYKNFLLEPDTSVKELLMGFQPGARAAPGLTKAQRGYLLGQTT